MRSGWEDQVRPMKRGVYGIIYSVYLVIYIHYHNISGGDKGMSGRGAKMRRLPWEGFRVFG